MLRPALPLSAPPTLAFPKERLVSPRELRTFLGEPKQRQWKALLKKAGVELRWSNGNYRCGLNRNQVLRIMRVRYASVGERRIKRWRLG